MNMHEGTLFPVGAHCLKPAPLDWWGGKGGGGGGGGGVWAWQMLEVNKPVSKSSSNTEARLALLSTQSHSGLGEFLFFWG